MGNGNSRKKGQKKPQEKNVPTFKNITKKSKSYKGNVTFILIGVPAPAPTPVVPQSTNDAQPNANPNPFDKKFRKQIAIPTAIYLVLCVAIYLTTADIQILLGIVAIFLLGYICFLFHVVGKSSLSFLYPLIPGIIVLSISYKISEIRDFLTPASKRIVNEVQSSGDNQSIPKVDTTHLDSQARE